MSKAAYDPVKVRFMVTFQKLRNMIDDEPSGLEDLAAGEEELQALCLDTHWTALQLERAEQRHRQLFTAPVDPAFVQAWRDYSERYASVLEDISDAIPLADILGVEPAFSPKQGQVDQFERALERACDEGREWESDIESVFTWAKQQIDVAREHWDFPDKELADQIDEGISNWYRLAGLTGLRVADVIRRRMSVPFVLIPRHVSAHHGSGEKLSLLTKLQQAQEAFVFGLPLAALALMRSVSELVPEKHYNSTGSDLNERIKNARHVPAKVKDRLHGLRKLANNVLHAESDKPELPKDLGRQLITYLVTLRDLIEQAPTAEPIRRRYSQ